MDGCYDMKNNFFAGIAVAVLGLLIALVPTCIFPTCTQVIETVMGGTVPMKCFWSGQAEIGLGFLILCGGVLLIFFKSPHARIGVSCMTALAGLVSLLIPTLLIGGCEMDTMACQMTTFPAIIILSVLTVVVCAVNVCRLQKRNTKNQVRTDG
jgi:hypothetical protein